MVLATDFRVSHIAKDGFDSLAVVFDRQVVCGEAEWIFDLDANFFDTEQDV